MALSSRAGALVAVAAASLAAIAAASAAHVAGAVAPAARVDAAGKAVGAASSYRFRLVMTMTSKELAKPVHVVMEGRAQRKPTRVAMRMDMTEAVALNGGKKADGIWEIRQIEAAEGLLLYVSGAPFASVLGKRTWGLVNVSKLPAAERDALLKQLTQGADATAILPVLKAQGAKVREAGKEPVAGVATTRYHVVTDMAALARNGATKEELAKLRSELGEDVTSISYDVWLDGQGLLRRMRMALPIASPGSANLDVDMDMTLGSYGEAVAVARPAAADVADITAAVAGSTGKGGGTRAG